MGKKSRLKKLRRAAKTKSGAGLDLRQFHHPFAGIPVDAVRRGAAEFGRSQAKQFASTTTKVEELIRGANPLCSLASLAAYGLTNFIGGDGSIAHPPEKEILPAHVELAQAMCLRVPADQHSRMPALGPHLQALSEALAEWSEQFHSKRLTQIESAGDDTERARLSVQEEMRVATQIVRNWGYYDQVKSIAIDLLSSLDERFTMVHGFRGTDLVSLFDYLFHEWQRRLNDHWDRLRGMMTATTMREAIESYYSAFSLENAPEGLIEELRQRRADLQTAKVMMMSHADLRLSDVSTFEVSDIAVAIQRPDDVVARALDAVSLQFGELGAANIEHFFMSNPIWTKPLIKLRQGSYFCVMPQLFFAFLFETLHSLVRPHDALRSAYDTRRCEYLETRVRELFSSAFPRARITSNFKWHNADRSQQFESDLIAQVDSFVFLVEAKSGRVSAEARRGAPDRLGNVIDSLLVAPSLQSKRLEEAILAARRGDHGTEEFRRSFPCELSDVHRVIRLSVTLEDVGFLQTRVNNLKSAGYVPQDLLVAPAVTIADLEIVFEILTSEATRIHYWIRRNQWEGRANYMADEIDLLGVYLKTGLDLGDLEFGSAHLVLIGESKRIDDYYEARREGIQIEKPQYQATAWWHSIVARLESKRPHRWLEAAAVLLCAGIDQQREIERRAKGLLADVRKNREQASSRNALVFVPARGRTEAIAILVLTQSQMGDRYQKMENIASQAFHDNQNVRECVVVLLDADGELYPYSTMVWYSRPDLGSAVRGD